MKDNIYTTKLLDVILMKEKSCLFMIMEYIPHDLKEVLDSKTLLNET